MATISFRQLRSFMQLEPYAVQASISAVGAPQAALVGVVVSDRLEVFFDTLVTSRKAINLHTHSRVAFVIGPTDAAAARTVQLEGVADLPTGEELDRLLELYLARFPAGRVRRTQPNVTYFRVRPTWLRYSDFSVEPPRIVQFDSAALTSALDAEDDRWTDDT